MFVAVWAQQRFGRRREPQTAAVWEAAAAADSSDEEAAAAADSSDEEAAVAADTFDCAYESD